MKDVVLSLVQMHSAVGDTDGNLKNIELLTEEVKGRSDIICFPEACLTGYETADPEQFCISLDDDRISAVSDISRECGANIIFGFMERNGQDMHITQAVSDTSGRIGIYRKTHLGIRERKKFIPGNEIPVFKLPEASVGVQLCWESHFPGISAKMRKGGADIILISYASPLRPDIRKETWMKHLPARAYDNGVFVGAVNAVGDNGRGITFGGGAMAFDPKGNVIAENFSEKDLVVTVELQSSFRSRLGSDEDMRNIDYFRYRRDELY